MVLYIVTPVDFCGGCRWTSGHAIDRFCDWIDPTHRGLPDCWTECNTVHDQTFPSPLDEKLSINLLIHSVQRQPILFHALESFTDRSFESGILLRPIRYWLALAASIASAILFRCSAILASRVWVLAVNSERTLTTASFDSACLSRRFRQSAVNS